MQICAERYPLAVGRQRDCATARWKRSGISIVHNAAVPLFAACGVFRGPDQAVATPFRQRMTHPADVKRNPLGAAALCASFRSHQQGRHDRGPYLDAESAGGVRCVYVRWRRDAGSILVQDADDEARPTIKHSAPERETTPVFVFESCVYGSPLSRGRQE
jgi:hypothetical protein